jgi:hypothetical protein
MTALAGWQNFYVIVGSSAGALIGLQFVLITLIANIPVGEGGEDAGHAFATPTIVHFGAVLMLAGIATAPWRRMLPVAVLWAALGLFGLVYSAIVTRRMRQQTKYRPEFEDWLFHAVLPFVAYAIVASGAMVTESELEVAMFGVAAACLLLLLIGIHNAWDAATYHVFVVKQRTRRPGNSKVSHSTEKDNEV